MTIFRYTDPQPLSKTENGWEPLTGPSFTCSLLLGTISTPLTSSIDISILHPSTTSNNQPHSSSLTNTDRVISFQNQTDLIFSTSSKSYGSAEEFLQDLSAIEKNEGSSSENKIERKTSGELKDEGDMILMNKLLYYFTKFEIYFNI
jgi:hypothetical protein